MIPVVILPGKNSAEGPPLKLDDEEAEPLCEDEDCDEELLDESEDGDVEELLEFESAEVLELELDGHGVPLVLEELLLLGVWLLELDEECDDEEDDPCEEDELLDDAGRLLLEELEGGGDELDELVDDTEEELHYNEFVRPVPRKCESGPKPGSTATMFSEIVSALQAFRKTLPRTRWLSPPARAMSALRA